MQNEYVQLLNRLRKHKKKIKDLPELIFKITFNQHRLVLLEGILRVLDMEEDCQNFKWMDSEEQRNLVLKKKGKILAQFSYQFKTPNRVLTITKKNETAIN